MLVVVDSPNQSAPANLMIVVGVRPEGSGYCVTAPPECATFAIAPSPGSDTHMLLSGPWTIDDGLAPVGNAYVVTFVVLLAKFAPIVSATALVFALASGNQTSLLASS